MKVWFPLIRADTGTDVFTRRLAIALRRFGVAAETTYFPQHFEYAPFLLRSFPPPPGTQLIHANSWSGFAFAHAGIPLVVTEHLNVLDPIYGPFKTMLQRVYHEALIRRFMRASFTAASAITTVSHFVQASLATTLNIGSASVIHNWIDTRRFRPQFDDSDNQRLFRLLFVGNPSRRKGADLLAPIMKNIGSDFKLLFTSGANGRNPFTATPNMICLGRLTRERDLVATYHQCDALLLPTRFEGFGLSAIEAMSCGKPVIATNCCSLPEVVGDGVAGILCPLNDIQAFSCACRKLAEDRETRRLLGRRARERAEQFFSEERIIPQYVALYESLVQ